MTKVVPWRHYILPEFQSTELGRWLEEIRGFVPGLFLYWHASTRNFVISRWLNRSAGFFQEIHVVGKTLSGFTREKLKEFLDVLRFKTQEEINEFIRVLSDVEYNEDRHLTDESQLQWEKRQPRKVQILTS